MAKAKSQNWGDRAAEFACTVASFFWTDDAPRGERQLALTGLALWAPAAPCLALTLTREVVDLRSVYIEHNLAAPCVLVLDD